LRLFGFTIGLPALAPPAAGSLAAQIRAGLPNDDLAAPIRERLEAARDRRLPWTATLTPSELGILRSHGLRPVAAVSATCWMGLGQSWSATQAEGWARALRRLWEEARAAGANAVLDVKMRTLRQRHDRSMDFTLLGTAVSVDGLPPSGNPAVATVPALEFVKLLDADVVPTGIAVGAASDWIPSWIGTPGGASVNYEQSELSRFWSGLRRRALAELRTSAEGKGNGVLAHVQLSQLVREERLVGRHIVVATTIDGRRRAAFRQDVGAVLDLRAGPSPLAGRPRHHQSYGDGWGEGTL
jgi:uncharacterized protein YbjQ (UPF0145 family)